MQSFSYSRTRRLTAYIGVASILLLSSCSDDGGDDEGASGDTEAPEETTEATAGDDDELLVANTCADIPEPEGGAVNQTAVVDLIDFEFCQPEITIEAGDAIEFVNFGATRHQVAHQPPGDQERFFRSDPLLTGDSFVKTIETPGVYPFICSYHYEQMSGTITVE